MCAQIFSTKQIADAAGIHPNTVRFYEKMGFLTAPERRANGYRAFTDVQAAQCRLIRRAMQAEVLQNGLRHKAVEIVRLCAALEFDAAQEAVAQYRAMIALEIENARAAAAYVENMRKCTKAEKKTALSRRETAAALHVTAETLRTWERSGLLPIRRRENGYHFFTDADLVRLRAIRTLRLANYSLSAILRLLNRLDMQTPQSVEAILDTPSAEEDIVSVCDRLISSLQNTALDAQALGEMIEEIRAKYLTLQ